MDATAAASLTRRSLLLGASALAGLALSGAGRRFGLLGDSRAGEDHAALLERLHASLSDDQRRLVCFPWDHPARQVTNTTPVLRRPHIGTLLSAEQRELVLALVTGMLSPAGMRAFAPTLAVDAGGVDACNLALYGEPGARGFQASISGAHLHVRTPSGQASGVAFGGPIAYGQQRGNHEFKVAGNSFAFHSDLANALYAALTPEQRIRARTREQAQEYVLQPQAAGGGFPGLPARDMDEAQQASLRALLEAVFASYPAAAQAEAWSYIDHNGGITQLHAVFFEDKGFYPDRKTYAELPPAERARRGEPYFQVWRIEGPGTVIHFKGHPHVHAYVNVVRDPLRANVGEALARLDTAIEGERVRTLLQTALARQTGTAAGYSGREITGRLCPGEVTTGALWSLDPYDNTVVVATIRSEAMAPDLRAALAAQRVAAPAGGRLRVATSAYFAGDANEFGTPDAIEPTGRSLREVLVAHVRSGGLRPS
jgi:Protein of unknown function (DUF3500)